MGNSVKIALVALLFFLVNNHFVAAASVNYLGYSNGASLVSITTENGGSTYGALGNCNEGDTSTWSWLHALCDRDDSVDTQNNLTHAYAPDEDAGTTWSCSGDPNVKGVMITDLGATRTYNELRIFEMVNSDGYVTHVQLFENESAPGVWTPVISETTVQDGSGYFVPGGLPEDYIVTSPTIISFSDTTSRYVQLKFRNDGRSAYDTYIEVFSAKLFNSNENPIFFGDGVPEFSDVTLAFAIAIAAVGGVFILKKQE